MADPSPFPVAAVDAVIEFIEHRIRVRGSAEGLAGDAGWISGIVANIRRGSTPEVDRCRRTLEFAIGRRLQDGAYLYALIDEANTAALRRLAERAEQRRQEELAKQREREHRVAERRALAERRAEQVKAAIAALEVSYLHPAQIEPIPDDVWEEARAAFVQAWARSTLGIELDAEQAAAVGATDPQVKVVARAGSGKTRVLTTRATFLEMVCGVEPGRILLLVFNRAARHELEKRLRRHSSRLPHVMTFHALAWAIDTGTQLLVDDADERDQRQRAVIADAISELIDTAEGRSAVWALMELYFRVDLVTLTAAGLTEGVGAGLPKRRELQQETLLGEKVDSFAEKWIANTLLENGVEYEHRRAREAGRDEGARACFTVSGAQILLGDPSSLGVRLHGQSGAEGSRIYVDESDVEAGNTAPLLANLAAAGITTRSLTPQEIWDRCREHATKEFTEAMQTLISRAVALGRTPSDLRIAGGATGVELDGKVGELAAQILETYLAICSARGVQDFSTLIWRAARAIQAGTTFTVRPGDAGPLDLTKIEHVLVDELQDFTPGFRALLTAIRSVAPAAQVMGVGDDWQAINRFAGAEPKLFIDNAGPIDTGTRQFLRTNYRSRRGIVRAGNDLMRGVGTGAEALAYSQEDGGAGVVARHDVRIWGSERSTVGGDRLRVAIMRIVRARVADGHDVTLLARTQWPRFEHRSGRIQTLWDLVDDVRRQLPPAQRNMVDAQTIHRYKGREAAVVILVDVHAGRYPLLHPRWVFGRILGDTLATVREDERRLFYVGLTRGRLETILITGSGRSEFFDELEAVRPLWDVAINQTGAPLRKPATWS